MTRFFIDGQLARTWDETITPSTGAKAMIADKMYRVERVIIHVGTLDPTVDVELELE